MFNQSKYTKWYYLIIESSRDKPISGYYEKHHIIPTSLGGSNNKENIVKLSARAHYICHLLLTKMVTGESRKKMIYAFWILSNRTSKKNSRIYQTLRESFSMMIKQRKHTEESKKKISESQTGKVLTEEHKERLRQINTGLKRNFSLEHRENLSKAGKGRVITAEWKENLSRSNKGQGLGRKLSDETKSKLSLARRATVAKKASCANEPMTNKIDDQCQGTHS